MSVPLGLARLHPSAAADRPHYLGYATARTVADDSLFDLWNGATSAARVLRINKDGQIQAANGTVALPPYSFESDKDSGVYRIGANNIGVAVAGAKVLDVGVGGLGVTGTLTVTGTSYIGDTSNANVTLGLTINQGAADDKIFALKKSAVAHGLTSRAETDTYLDIQAYGNSFGGGYILAIGEDDAARSTTFGITAWGGQADPTKSTAARALIELFAGEHDGANTVANVTADGNVFGVLAQVGGSAIMRFLVDEDGDTWQAGSLTTVGALLPNANDGAALGASGTAWADLFLASGAVINFNAGDVTLTHSAGILTVSAGDLRVTTAGTNAASAVTVGGTQTLTAKTLTSPTLTSPTISGTVAGTPTWASSQAITLSTAAQAAITSLGTLTSLTVNGAVIVSTVNGIDVNPGSDVNADLITVGVTGAPTIAWDETNDLFAFTKGLTVTGSAYFPLSAALSWNGADAVITHSAAVLTVSTGDLRVTTAGTNAASVVTVGGTQTLTAKTLTSPTIGGAPSAAGATWSNLGAVTTIDINGGTVDGVVIGGASAAAGSFTTLGASGLLTASAGLTLAGNFTFSAAASQIIPGVTTWAVRNNANNANNIVITDAGAVSFRSTVDGITALTVNGTALVTTLGSVSGNLTVGLIGDGLCFYAGTPIARQTGVAVSAAGIHAALVNLNLITA